MFVCFDQQGQAADIAAWRPGQDFALWRGRVWALVEEQVGMPALGEPLHVHGSVLDWLRAAREGIVILNPSLAAWGLRFADTLGVETAAAANTLRDLLILPPPPIVVWPFVSVDLKIHEAAA